VCGFIQSLEENHYDEDGEINLSNLSFDTSKWSDYHQYTKFVSPVQIIGLVASISLFLGLLFYSCCLRNSLVRASKVSASDKKRKQKPHNFGGSLLYQKRDTQRGHRLSRIHSGITRHRSRGESFDTWASDESSLSPPGKTWATIESSSLRSYFSPSDKS